MKIIQALTPITVEFSAQEFHDLRVALNDYLRTDRGRPYGSWKSDISETSSDRAKVIQQLLNHKMGGVL